MFTIAFVIFSALIIGYIVFSLALLYHTRVYIVEKRHMTRTLSYTYVLTSAALIVLATYSFFQIPWHIIGV